MPWMETLPMDERKRFVEACRSRAWTMTELCDRFSVSRKTGYKWLRRADTEGWVGVRDREPEAEELPLAHAGRGRGSHRRGSRRPPELGTGEDPRVPREKTTRADAARREHRGETARQPWIGVSPQSSPAVATSMRPSDRTDCS